MEHEEEFDFNTALMSTVHDIKNSLSMLLGTLEETSQSEEIQSCPFADQIQRLQYEAKRVNNDLIQLLGLYKVSNQRFAPSIAHHSVDDFLDELAIEYAPLLEFNGITLEVECEPNLDWFFDRALIAGVITNVLNNEVRYGKDRVLLTAKVEDKHLVIHLNDNGPGYPQRMLLEGGEAPAPSTFGNSSTGLGLYFAMLAARAHRNEGRAGFIRIANDGPLGGGDFSIYLP